MSSIILNQNLPELVGKISNTVLGQEVRGSVVWSSHRGCSHQSFGTLHLLGPRWKRECVRKGYNPAHSVSSPLRFANWRASPVVATSLCLWAPLQGQCLSPTDCYSECTTCALVVAEIANLHYRQLYWPAIILPIF